MIRLLLIFIFLMFCVVNAQEVPLQAGVKYNEASARLEVFEGVERKIKKDLFAEYKKDKNRDENIKAVKNNIFQIENKRTLCPFYIKKTLISYAVMYPDMPEYSFYYNVLGSLIKIDIMNSEEYPRKIFGYSRFGNLISASFEVDENEQFVYDENGKLIAHWVGDEVLNKDNKSPRMMKLRRGK